MNKKQQKALRAITKVLDGAGIKTTRRFAGPSPALINTIETLAMHSYVGWISSAGRVADGAYRVQFNIAGYGWSSNWLQWAYEVALAALVNRKKVWIIASDIPVGANLMLVLVIDENR